MRINVFLARCRVASRRGADVLLADGRVTVNGRIAVPGDKVDPDCDQVFIDGKPLDTSSAARPGARTTILLHKPKGYLVSRRDPHHARTVYDLLPHELHRLVPVGRLDLNTEGALLMSDDGILVERLTHPRYQVAKVYRAVVSGKPDGKALERLRHGIEIDGGITSPAEVNVVSGGERALKTTELEIVLREGRKRQVRLMCRAIGHPVIELRRIRFAGIGLSGLKKGRWRYVSEAELQLSDRQSESVHGSHH